MNRMGIAVGSGNFALTGVSLRSARVPATRWNRWVKVAAPVIGTDELTTGIVSGIAIRAPASQICPPWRRRSCLASASVIRRTATSWKYSRPSRKPFSPQKITGASGGNSR